MPRSATLALCLLLTSCAAGDRAASGTWAGTIDTLASGTVHTRNPVNGLWDEATTWRIEEELRIGTMDGTGPDLFGYLYDIAVDDYGRIYALDEQAREVPPRRPLPPHHRPQWLRTGRIQEPGRPPLG